jgi:hypothetical protein
VKSLADDDAVGRHDDSADHRIRAGPPAAARGMEQGTLHELCVAQHWVIWSSDYLVIGLIQSNNQ